MELEERVTSMVAEQLGLPKNEVTRSSSFLDDLTDSLTMVELMMTMEEEFNLEIDDDAAAKMTTVGDVIDYLKGHVSA